MTDECGCPSHHEHGPEGAAGCAICNQEARSGRRQPLDGTTPVTPVSREELTAALDEIITRLAGGQATMRTEDSSNFTRESSGPDRLPPILEPVNEMRFRIDEHGLTTVFLQANGRVVLKLGPIPVCAQRDFRCTWET